MVLLRLFGGASLESAKKPITGRSAQRRRIALLALLGVSRRGLTRDKLIGYLWAENDAEKARRLLSESLYVLRKELGEDSITVAGDELRLNPGVVDCDVVAFEDAIERGDLETAVALHVGPFLDGFYVSDALELEHWIESERDRLSRLYLRALEGLAEAAAAGGHRDDAVSWWRRMAEMDPYSGRFAVGLMQALDAAGHRAAALQHAQIHATLLREELEAEPDPAVASLADQLRDSPESVWSPPAGRERAATGSGAGDAAVAENPSEPASAPALRRPVEPVHNGTVTFLFSDIEGSTALLRRLGPRYADLLTEHHAIIRDCMRQNHGREVDTAGDGFFIAFPRARDAVAAAVRIQQRVGATDWPEGVTVRLRMGLHTGEPAFTDTGFVGIDVHRAARICGLAAGGRILVSGVTRELLGGDLPAGVVMRDLGLKALRDIEEPEHLWEIELEATPRATTLAVAGAAVEPLPAGHDPAPAVTARTTGAVMAGPATVRPVWRRPGFIAPLALVGLVAAVGLLFRGPSRPAPSAAPTVAVASDPGTTVVVLPLQCLLCEDETAYGGDYVMHRLSSLLDVGDVRTISAHRVLADPSVSRADRDAALLAARFGASHSVGGYISVQGDRLTISAELERHGVDDTATPQRFEEAGGSDELDILIQRLASHLIVALIGGPGREIAVEGIWTTLSPEARRAWLEGEREFAAGSYLRARSAYEAAVRADRTFPYAHYRLSMIREWLLDFRRAHSAAADAVRHSGHLDRRQAALIRAWEALLKGRVQEARRLYDRAKTERPDEVEAWYGLAELAAHFNPLTGQPIEPAAAWFRKVFDLIETGGATAPNYGDTRYHLLEFAAAARDWLEFDELLAGVDTASEQWLAWQATRAFGRNDVAAQERIMSALEQELDETRIGMAAARVGATLHDFETARRIAAILATRPGVSEEWQAGARLLMAQIDFGSGRLSDAVRSLDATRPFDASWAHEIGGLFVLPGFVPVSRDRLVTLRDQIHAWSGLAASPLTEDSFLGVHYAAHRYLRPYLLGMLSLRLDDPDAAERYHRQLARLVPGDDGEAIYGALEPSLRAHLALARGGPRAMENALSLLRRNVELAGLMEQVGFSPFYSRAYDRLVTAELLREQGDYPEALDWYRSLTEGYEVLFVAPAHYRMAGIYETLRDTASAGTHTREFERLWMNADPAARAALERVSRW